MWTHLLILILTNIVKASSETTTNLSVDSCGNTFLTDHNILNDTGTTNVVYGSGGNILCNINSSVPIHILWYHVDKTTGKINQIISSDKYLISNNGTELRIKKMDLDMVGKYICTAAYAQKVEIVLTAPEITGKYEIKAIRGSNVIIECKIVKGLPKPTIFWEYNNQNETRTGNVLHLYNVADSAAGRYKCVAENVAGRDEHVTTLVVESPPRILSKPSAVYESFEGDKSLKIVCDAVGVPPPVNTWLLNGNVITPNKKYNIENGALIISNLTEEDSTEYTCEAKNYIGTENATFTAIVKTAPKITGSIEIRAIKGSNVEIQCKIIKGTPQPKIFWEYNNQTEPRTGNVLRLYSVADSAAGRYKCVAENVAGRDEHVTTLVVEFPPRIISKPSTVFGGLVGDIALRIPCDVVGIPQPIYNWKINGNLITPNKKYSVEDGDLIIKNPILKDSTSYTCEAGNYLGSDNATFTANIEEFINSLEIKSRYVYLLKGETRKLVCEGYNSTSQSVRWFMEDVEVGSGKPYFEVTQASFNDDGNYTCRVNDEHGHSHTHTYVVDVGYPPQLYEQIPTDDWRGDVAEIFSNCDSTAKPIADVKWEFNGQMLTYQNLTEVGDSLKWGNYKCNVTNVHGSELRSFDVRSSACFVNRKLEDLQNMPLLLTHDLTYPDWVIMTNDLLVEQGEEITLYCPHQNKDAMNTFQNFQKQSDLKAFCHKQDMFLVNNKPYRLSDLLCNKNIKPVVSREKNKCLTETSEWIRVGYNVASFLESYKVCFDHAKNIPLYTRVLVTETDDRLGATHDWYTHSGIGNGKLNRGFTCKYSNSTCCFNKTQIVNPTDFKYSSAKKTTFYDFLNTIPYWRSCADRKKTTWEDINEMVRSQHVNYGDFVVWSGTHTFQVIDGAFIPRYLWKVVMFTEEETVAIVHVNDPTPNDEDIKCEDISSTDDISNWFTASDKFTYCCTLPSFIEAFNMHGIDFREEHTHAWAAFGPNWQSPLKLEYQTKEIFEIKVTSTTKRQFHRLNQDNTWKTKF